MTLLIISFIAGILTVLAPCILPLLPVVVGGALADSGGINKKRAFTIIGSLGISVIVFTILLKATTLLINIPPDFWTWFSGGIIVLIGIIFLFPVLYEGGWMARLSAKSNVLLASGERRGNFAGNVIMGAALGPVFSTCSPTYFIVLATVLPVSPALGMVYILAYVLGLSLSLLLITFLGQKIMARLGLVANPRGWVKKFFGILFILVGIAIITGADKNLQTKILDSGFFDITKVEQKLLEFEDNRSQEKEEESPEEEVMMEEDEESETTMPNKDSKKYELAKDISSPDAFINTGGEPISIHELRGDKVVLIDFWTYSCINCQRTTPYLNAWYEKYKDQGLEIIGIHTPEFAFERLEKNVRDAVEKARIEFPVVLDNDYSTWTSYGNRYWPRKYLIDIDGHIIYDHIGEGAYEETEMKIKEALEDRAEKLSQDVSIGGETVGKISKTSFAQSPEIYFGSWRNEHLANGEKGSGLHTYTLPEDIEKNKLYLEGPWGLTWEYAESQGESKIVFRFEAKEVYMVASSPLGVDIDIYQDGVFVKTLPIGPDQLYTLIENDSAGEHTLEIRIPENGLQAFTFTFG